MKNIISTLLLVVSITGLSNAQSIGIGTSVPDASAILDINSTTKGFLVPRVYLLSGIDNSTVPNPAPYVLVYNINPSMKGGKGLFHNISTGQTPDWQKVGDIELPYYKATSSNTAAFKIENYLNNAGATALHGYSFWGTGIYASSSNGNALEVNGKIKITGAAQTPAAGKVLTSDANGNATWEGAIAFSSTGIQPDGAAEFTTDVEKKVPFYTEDYDLGNNYNPSAISPYSTFTAPVRGIYHFDVRIQWSNQTASYDGGTLNLKTTLNNTTKYRASIYTEFGIHYLPQEISRDLLLEEGEQVFVTAKQNTGSTVNIDHYTYQQQSGGLSAYFSGRLVTRL